MFVDCKSKQASMEWGEAGQWGRVVGEPLKFVRANNFTWRYVGQTQPGAAQAVPKEHSCPPPDDS